MRAAPSDFLRRASRVHTRRNAVCVATVIAAFAFTACQSVIAHPGQATSRTMSDTSIPAGAADVARRLAHSPRNVSTGRGGGWVTIKVGADESIRALVFPPLNGCMMRPLAWGGNCTVPMSPAVILIHDARGETRWIEGVADQLAADGFTAIQPDLLSVNAPAHKVGDTLTQSAAVAAIHALTPEEIDRRMAAVERYVAGRHPMRPMVPYGILGFGWGANVALSYAAGAHLGLSAAVVYDGVPPSRDDLARVTVPVLGLFGGVDTAVSSAVARTDSAMSKIYEYQIFDRAASGFLRDQSEPENFAAAEKAWPATIAFLHRHLRP